MPQNGSQILALIYPLAISGYPLVAGFSVVLGIENRPLSIVFRAILLILCLITIFRVLTNRIQITRGIIWVPIIAFWFLYLIRLGVDTYVDPIELSRNPSEYWLFGVFGALIPMIAFMARLDTQWSAIAFRRTHYLLLLAALVVILAFFKEIQSGASLALQIGRLSISSLSPIALGHLGGSLFVLTLCTLGTEITAKNRIISLLIFSMSILIGAALLISASSKGPILATMVAAGLLGASKLSGRRGLLLSGLLVVCVISAPRISAIVEAKTPFSPIQRIASVGYDESVSLRVQMYKGAFDQFSDHPILGNAIEEETSKFYPHNLILEAFMATGIIGGVSFLTLVCVALIRAWRVLRRSESEQWIAVLFIQAFVGSLFSGSLYGSGVMWMLMAGVLAVRRQAK